MRRPGQGEKNTHRYTAAAAAVRLAAKESRLNHYDEYGADQPMLAQPVSSSADPRGPAGGLASASATTMTGSSSKMMHLIPDHDGDVYYKKLPSVPPPPPVNGGSTKHLEDFKVNFKFLKILKIS